MRDPSQAKTEPTPSPRQANPSKARSNPAQPNPTQPNPTHPIPTPPNAIYTLLSFHRIYLPPTACNVRLSLPPPPTLPPPFYATAFLASSSQVRAWVGVVVLVFGGGVSSLKPRGRWPQTAIAERWPRYGRADSGAGKYRCSFRQRGGTSLSL